MTMTMIEMTRTMILMSLAACVGAAILLCFLAATSKVINGRAMYGGDGGNDDDDGYDDSDDDGNSESDGDNDDDDDDGGWQLCSDWTLRRHCLPWFLHLLAG